MKVFRDENVPFKIADAQTFVGRAHIKRLAAADAAADEGVPIVVYRVEFESGARTNWHVHSGVQWLMIIDGRVRVQQWGEAPREVGPGDAVMIAPGEKHWHGASPGGRAVHLAINVNLTTEWLEAVSDDEYGRTS